MYGCCLFSFERSITIGGAVAAPIFKEIADKVYSNRIELHGTPDNSDSAAIQLPIVKAGEQKELKKILAALNVPVKSNDDEALNVSSNIGTEQLVLNERKNRTGIVPDVYRNGCERCHLYS